MKLDAAATKRAAQGTQPLSSLFKAVQSREALLAVTTMQLRPGDLLLAETGDATAAHLAPRAAEAREVPGPLLPAMRAAPRLLLAASMAAALKASGTDHLVLIFVRPDAAEPDWISALQWAQNRLLPLILVFADARGRGAFQASSFARTDTLSWQSVSRTTQKLQMPVLAADGEDAVAMYRVMQESVLRARSGGGPAILWAMLPHARELARRPPADAPLNRLRRYLRSRKIALR